MAKPTQFPPSIRIELPPHLTEGASETVPFAKAKLVITSGMVAQASRYVQSGAAKGKIVEWRDVKQPGLVLRMRSRSATWLVRRRDRTFTIGSVDEISVYTARSLTASALHVESLNGDPQLYLSRMRHVIVSKGEEAAYYYDQKVWIDDDGTVHGPESPVQLAGWTWAHLRTQYIAFKKPTLSDAWAPQFEKLFHHRAFARIENVRVADIGLDELVDVKAALQKELSSSQASRALTQAKKMLVWAYNEYPKQTGMTKNTIQWWLPLSIESKPKRRFRSPTKEELVRTIILVEHLFETSGRGGRNIGAGMVGALWAVVLTGQRIGHLLKTAPDRYFEHEDLPKGWRVINWTADEMKPAGGQPLPHALPLPPEALEIIERYRSLAGPAGRRWLFPSTNKQTCVSNAGLEGLLRRLNGVSYWVERYSQGKGPGRKGTKNRSNSGRTRHQSPSLLASNGIEPWTPHDVRRSLQSFVEDAGLGGAGSAILAHREGRKFATIENDEERAQPTTRIHYSRGQKIALKAKGMKLWIDAVLAAYDTARREFEEAFRLRSEQSALQPLVLGLDGSAPPKEWTPPTFISRNRKAQPSAPRE